MKNKYIILLVGVFLLVGFIGGASIINKILESKPSQYGTIYLKPNEIQYAPALKEKVGANVIVFGLLGETVEGVIPLGNIKDII